MAISTGNMTSEVDTIYLAAASAADIPAVSKALGWRSRRIVAQALGESVAFGIAGAAAGVGLGFAGAAIMTGAAPKASAIPGTNVVV